MTATYTYAADLQLDVHRAEFPVGVVVYVHGGGFAFGDRSMDAHRCAALANHGLTVVAIDYRLAPATYPEPVEDVIAAVAWVRSHPDEVGVRDPRIALWGASAGAVLASIAGLTTKPAVQAVVSWFGFADLATSATRSPLEAQLLPPSPGLNFIGAETLEGNEQRAADASPITYVAPNAPPFLIAHGDRDRVADLAESRQLHDALARAGASSTLLILGGAGHEDPKFDSPASISITAAFLRSHLQQFNEEGTS